METTVKLAAQVKTIYFGLDISKACFDAGWREAGQAALQRHELRLMKVLKYERSRAGAKSFALMAQKLAGGANIVVVMESTGSYSLELACWLRSVLPGAAIADVPPKRVRDWCASTGVRAKTDAIDAALIACYGAERQPPVHDQRGPLYQELRALTRAREAFVYDRQAQQQRLEEVAREHNSGEMIRVLTSGYNRVIKSLEREIGKLEDKMKQLMESHPDLRADFELGDSLPGMGLITVATLFGEAGDLRRFGSRELVAFAGLDPVTRQSGTSVVSPRRITRRGNTRIRRILANAAWAATRTKNDNPFKNAYYRLVARGKPTLVALNAVMKKMLTTLRAALIAGAYMPVINTPQAVENPKQTVQKLAVV